MLKRTISLVLLQYVLFATSQSKFPADFVWGSAIASYQVEGAWNVSGRGLSWWDTFSSSPDKVANGDNGNTADDHYNRYTEDIALMQDIGFSHYRLSLSWSRILPNGELPVNQEGIQHYLDVFAALETAGIEPFVTLYHWDLPQSLANKGGWLNETIVEAFKLYADVCFQHFPKVKLWLTFNEPLTFTNLGYLYGIHAPGRCSDRSVCDEGDSSTEPYIAAHNVLLSHASAVALYRQKYEKEQKGKIGITLNCDWAEPYLNTDRDAAERYLEFQLSWYADPIWFGDYPASMKQRAGNRLPEFTTEQKIMLKGSYDFFGLNHYTTRYVTNRQSIVGEYTWETDQGTSALTHDENGYPIGPLADSSWLYVVPWGIRKLLLWIAQRYQNPEIYITENGVDVPNESSLPLEAALNDTFRVDYYQDYLAYVASAMEDGANVKGYFAWSLLDNFEWADGYSKRFGLHYVDYNDGLKRYPKASALWFKNLLKQSK